MPDRRLSRISLRRRWRIVGQPTVHGPMSRLRVGNSVGLGNVLINTYGGCVDIGDYVFFGHDVLLLAGTHDFRGSWPQASGDSADNKSKHHNRKGCLDYKRLNNHRSLPHWRERGGGMWEYYRF